jgi:hypothetical protein
MDLGCGRYVHKGARQQFDSEEPGKMDLDQLLNDLIEEAAKRFGPRYRPDWSIEPVRAERDDHPETIIDEVGQRITVWLTKSAASDIQQARYQLCHEAIHCLLAKGKRDTIYFEEGLAIDCALNASGLNRRYRKEAEATMHSVFEPPLKAFRALKPTDEKIKKLRAEVPDIDQLTPALVEKHFGAPSKAAEGVCQRMEFTRPKGI